MSVTVNCRVCGKPFEMCKAFNRPNDPFNWRTLACSPECGQEYFRRVEEARSKKKEVSEEAPVEEPIVEQEEPPVVTYRRRKKKETEAESEL